MDFSDNLRALGLEVTDPDLRAKLRLLRKENHPDTTGNSKLKVKRQTIMLPEMH